MLMLAFKKMMCRKCYFLVPGRLDRPVGGHKVIYQYANFLAEGGWNVVIVNNIFMPSKENALFELLRICHAALLFLMKTISGRNTCRVWFSLSPGIVEKKVWTFDKLLISENDFCVATDAVTSPYLNSFDLDHTHKLYFIQHYENWRMTDAQLRDTYHFDMKKVVISKWLGKILDEEGVDYSIVPNGFDRKEFFLSIPIEKKDRYMVSMLYHESPWKNVQLGLSALDIVKAAIPQLHVALFGVYDRPDDLPEWYEYYPKPSAAEHNEINNRASVYVGTSMTEGWGLTVGEAMLCGQAVCCTDAAGYLEMAIDGDTALVSDKHDANALAKNIISVIENDELRYRIAGRGMEYISQFGREESCKRFLSILAS